MAKKPQPRWGDDGVTEIQDFTFSPEQARSVAVTLAITRPDDAGVAPAGRGERAVILIAEP